MWFQQGLGDQTPAIFRLFGANPRAVPQGPGEVKASTKTVPTVLTFLAFRANECLLVVHRHAFSV